ncbi:MAG: SurA N-terminal domain-containing protein [Spirochaetaceae bacterium]|nr:SurA N-terminal domain-containing protein [Spirochaetaceae bacterium]
MLESLRKGQRWLTLLFVSVIGLVFVFFLGTGGGFGPATPAGNAVVQLDELRLTQTDFARERAATEAQLRAQLGDAFDQIGGSQFVDAQALGALINKVVLADAASELGLHVTREEIRRFVQSSPAFLDEEGRFDPEAFDRFASYEYGSQRAFVRAFSRDLLGQKLVQLLVGQTPVTDAELDLRARYELEEVRIAFVSLDATSLPEEEALSDEAVEAWAEENDERLRALFAEREADLAQPERVRARHVLVLAPPGAEGAAEDEARARAEAIRARLVAGEDFAAVAEEVSQDVATRATGGDLGAFARGTNDPALDEAAFTLEPGVLSEPIRTAYGYHILRVDEKLPAAAARFEDHRLALAREEATRVRALERADTLAASLAGAVEEGQSLEDAAREAGLVLERPPALRRRPDGFVPGLGEAEPVLNAAFALEAGESSPEIFDLGDRRVLIQVLEHDVPDAATLARERATRRDRVLAEKQNRALQSWIEQHRRELENDGRLLVNAELALGS